MNKYANQINDYANQINDYANQRPPKDGRPVRLDFEDEIVTDKLSL